MSKAAYEANLDGLVGPTHCYAGLSYGNTASMRNRASVSNPREAALQGLVKAKAMKDLGLKQGVLAPQERPNLRALHQLGFRGSPAEMLASAHKKAPELLAACASASSMWTANAATVCPSADSGDGRVHFTAANLTQSLHRAIEHKTTTRLLKAIFPDKEYFTHHHALIPTATMGDEGAANHSRFCREYGEPGVQNFIYGRVALDNALEAAGPRLFPARHTLEASQAITRLHGVKNAIYAQQNPGAIDAGAFHNDVVSVSNQNVLFYHEHAFHQPEPLLKDLRRALESACKTEFTPVFVPDAEVPLADAVRSYLFNSQLVTLKPGHMCLIAPTDCEETPSVARYMKKLIGTGDTPIKEAKYFNLRQSMANGGGPACLRLRVVLTAEEISAANPHCFMSDDKLFGKLKAWVEKHYRDRLLPADLADVKLHEEGLTALDELTQILHLGSVYPFQM